MSTPLQWGMLSLPHQGGVEFHHHENSVVKVQLGLLPGSTLPAVPRHICLFRLNESHDLLETGQTTTADADGRFTFVGVALAAGPNALTVRATDAAGNSRAFSQTIERLLPEDASPTPFAIAELSPVSGEERVSLSRPIVLRFRGQVDPGTVTPDAFYLIANGQRIPGRVVVSSTEEFATFYPDAPLPASAEVRVVIDGDRILGRNGEALDGDGDGSPGGKATAFFRTHSLARIPGTQVSGSVFDAHHRYADGSNIPIVGATIRVDGLPEVTAVTDENGFFQLEATPAPEFFVHIDGSTATSAPAGTTYASLGKPFHSVAGHSIPLQKHGEPFDIFLPTIATTDFQPLSATETTAVGLGAAGKAQLAALFPDRDAATWERLQVSFPPGSAQDRFGNPAPQATIVPVDPQRLPAPLPPNLDPQLVISIQAEGATTFDVPAPITFPNLTGLSPGKQALIFSFNHDAGRWETLGSGTVSPDGQTIASDPGVGIRAPGWHFADRGSPAHPMAEEEPEAGEFTAAGVQDYLFVDDGGSVTLQFSNQTEETVTVEIGFDPQTASAFLEDLPEQSTISLAPGTQRTVDFFVKDLLDPAAVDAATENILYGAKFGVSASSSSGTLFDRDMFVYRLFDIADDDHTDGTIDFEKTFNDDRGGVLQAKPLKFALLDEARPSLSLASATANPGADPIHFGVVAGDGDSDPQIQFDPARKDSRVIVGEQTDSLVLKANGNLVGNIQLRGTAVDSQKVFFSKQDFVNIVKEWVDDRYASSRAPDFVALFPDFDGDGKRSDEGNFQTTAGLLYDAIVKNLGLIFDHVDNGMIDNSASKDALSIVNASPSKNSDGIWVGMDNVIIDGQVPTTFCSSIAHSACADWIDFDRKTFNDFVAQESKTSLAQEKFRFDRITNQYPGDRLVVNLDILTENAQIVKNQFRFSGAIAFGAVLANVIAHEIAHLLGAIDLNQDFKSIYPTAGFLLGSPSLTHLSPFSPQSTPVVKTGLGLPVTATEFQTSYTYYKQVVNLDPSDFAPNPTSKQAVNSGNFGLPPFGTFDNSVAVNNEGLNLGLNNSVAADHESSTFILNPSVAANNQSLPPGNSVQIPSVGSANDSIPFLIAHQLWQPLNAPLLKASDSSSITLDEPTRPGIREVDLGATVADGTGGESSTFKMFLVNIGDQDLHIRNIELVDGGAGFSVEGVETLPDTLLPFNPDSIPLDLIELQPDLADRIELEASQHAITVRFDPDALGVAADVLRIERNSLRGKPVEIPLSGLGVSPAGDITVTVNNNNAGGQDVHGGAKIVEGFATIGNIGSRPLSITAIRTGPLGANQFAAANLPADFGPANPLAIDPGESFELDLAFDAKLLGLQRGEIQIVSDDPDTPIVTQAIVGTGTLDQHPNLQWGDDYVAVQSRNAPFPQRTRSSLTGDFDFILPGETPYKLAVFDPESGLIWHSVGRSAPSGQRTNFNLPSFWASDNPDSDGDGLPDDIEFAIGTSPDNPDTDGDGIDDFTEIQQDLDPLSGLAVPTGIVASLPLAGEAKAVVVAGTSGDVRQHTAYVATGSHGLALVDVSQFDEPILLSQLDLAGDAVDVAVDERLQLAAVASDIGGLHRLDVSDPLLPRLLDPLPLRATQVEAVDGIAYVASGDSLRAIDLGTGESLQQLSLPGSGTVTGLAREGTRLYTFVSGSDTFSVIDIAEAGAARVLGQLPVADDNPQVRVAVGTDDVVYLSGVGLQTIDVSDLTALTLMSEADLPFAAGGAALNGSGLVLATAEGRGLEIYESGDPQNTGAFLTRIATPGSASDVAIAAGIAYVADGSGGLQVANYLPFDAAGQAPELRIRGDVADLDRQTPGVQVLAGTSIPIQVDVSDDVQVRQVELLVNGEAVRHDLSFPFDLSAIAQSSDSSASTVEVQVRATDTGGNETLSNRLTFDWVPDTFAPTIEAIDPTDGAETARNLRRITVRFSEAIDAATAVAANFQLRNAAEEILTPETIQLRSDDKIVQLTYEPLAAGDYTLAIEGTAVTDRAGNALDTGVVTRSFSLLEGTIAWIGGSGSWHDATNWSTGTLPTADDIVIIDVPGEVTVRFEGGSAVVANLLSEEHVALAGGELTLTGASELNQGLSFSDGSLKMEADTILAGASRWSGGILDGAGALLNQGELMVSEGYAKELRSELTNTGILRQSSSFFDNQGTFNNRAGGLYEWLGGDLRGEGEFINQGQLTIAGVGGKKFVGNLTNEGTIAHVSSEIEFLERTFLKNSASGIYDLQAGRLATFFDENDNMEGGIFNEGIFRKSTDGSATVASIFESSGGRVEVQAGQLNLIGSTIQNGRLAIARDGVLAFAGGNVLNGTIEGNGLVRFNRNSNIIADGQVVFDLGEAGLE